MFARVLRRKKDRVHLVQDKIRVVEAVYLHKEKYSCRHSSVGDTLVYAPERAMQSDRSHLRELEIRVAHPRHWSAGEHRMNIENLRQLRFRLQDQLERLRQRTK